METVTRQDRRNKSKHRKKGPVIMLLAFIFVLLAAGTFTAKTYIDEILNEEGFYPGIQIDGIALEGKTKDEAAALLEKANQSRLDAIHISMKYNDQEWDLTYKDIDARLNIDEEIQKAYRIGREGNFIARLKEIRTVKKNNYTAETEITYNLDALKPKLAEIKEKIDKKAVDATVKFSPNAKNKFSFTAEKTGYVLDDGKIFGDIKTQLSDRWNIKLLLEPEVIEPKVVKADLEKATKRIAHFSTDLGSSTAARRHNISLSIGNFNGMMIKPGEELSFNETTGPRSLDRGYKNAPVIKADKSLEDGPGGGVCQSSTTLYNASLLAGLEITQRAHHSFPSHYVDKGFDATVNWPNLDLKIKNNRKTPVFIQSFVSGNYVHVYIYGEPLEKGRTIRLESKLYQTIPAPAPTIIKDTKSQYVTYTDEKFEKVKSRTGYKVKTYRVIYENGKEVSREVLANDYYKPIRGTTYVGVKQRPAPTPAPAPQPEEAAQ